MGSDRGSDIVSTLGPITVVPLPPSRVGTIENFSLPHTINEGNNIQISSFVPVLPDVITLRIVVNGVPSKDITYSKDTTLQSIWENAGQVIGIDPRFYSKDAITLTCFGGSIVINTIDVYIDGEKVDLIYG